MELSIHASEASRYDAECAKKPAVKDHVLLRRVVTTDAGTDGQRDKAAQNENVTMYGLVPRLFPDAPDSHPNLSADDPAYAQLEREVLDILRGHFRPEFLNRIDETILCHSLSREQIVHIVEIQLARVASYLEDRKITIERTENARELLASEGYDPAFGARPLKRVIQRMVLNALVNHLFAGDVKEGDHVIADVDLAMLGELTFTAKE